MLLVLLLKEVPAVRLAGQHCWAFLELTHLMKSASSELEALIGGVAVAVGFEAEGPDVAYLTPANMVVNQAMASCDKSELNVPSAQVGQLAATYVVAADLLAGNGIVSAHCDYLKKTELDVLERWAVDN